jgi:hypothetical protein
MRKALGYVLLVLSFLAWGAILALPLARISVGEAAALTTGLIVTGEAAFYLGVVLLGKEVWERIKAIFRRGRRSGLSSDA